MTVVKVKGDIEMATLVVPDQNLIQGFSPDLDGLVHQCHQRQQKGKSIYSIMTTFEDECVTSQKFKVS